MMKEEEELGLERTVKQEDIQECLDQAEKIEKKLEEEISAPLDYFVYVPEVVDESRKYVG